MTDINRKLQEYLSRNDSKSSQKENLLPVTVQEIKSTWFSQSEQPEETESSSWFSSAKTDPCFPSLSHKQRIFGFVVCISLGIICFILAFFYAPFLLIKARKFSLLFTLGSFFTIISFSFLWGPTNHLKYMFSSSRIVFTLVYLCSLFATLYCALSLQSTVLTSISACIQVGALLCFIISHMPGGRAGLSFMSSIVKKTASKALPI